MKELPAIVAKTKVGTNVKVKIWRNKKELIKDVLLGRLETSDDFKITQKAQPIENRIENLKINVRKLTNEDISQRKLPNQTKGLVITKIDNDSPLISSIRENSIIIEAQKRKIKSAKDLEIIVNEVLSTNQNTILLVIYNSQNQKEYIGVKLK